MCEGENFVSLTGYLRSVKLNEYSSGAILLRGRLDIPDGEGGYQSINVSCWGELAEALYTMGKNKCVRIHGHLDESKYDKKCKFCSGTSRASYFVVTIDNFMLKES
jgi:hypothetical protein